MHSSLASVSVKNLVFRMLLGSLCFAPAQALSQTLFWDLGTWDNNTWAASAGMIVDGDRDGDGVPDTDDQFPDNAAASLDFDGDGLPDVWGSGCDLTCQQDSGLILDLDDDNDGVPDAEDNFPWDPTKAGTPIAEAIAAIVDPLLRECLQSTINTQFQGAIYAEQITSFRCGADSLDGLRMFSRLQEIYIDNSFTNISELQYLEYLSSLILNNGPGPESLEPLRGKTSLKYLQLHSASQPFTDVILTLTGLEGLQFQYSDIPVLPDYSLLPNLRRLDMYRTNTQDISSVSGLTQLERFASFDNPLVDIGPVAPLTNLTFLALTGANAADLSSLANLVNVTELLLSGNNLTSLTDLSGMNQLTKLWVDRNPNLDVSVFPNGLGLVNLNLAATRFDDLSALSNTPNVSVLDISRNDIVDYTPLASLSGLIELRADRMTMPLTSLGQLPPIESLRTLWLWGNEISVLTDTQNQWVTFHYLAGNPVTCDTVQEFMNLYPSAGVYDAQNECVSGRLLNRPSKLLDDYYFDSLNRDRAVYYYALDDFAWAFPFGLSDEAYQLGTLGGFCTSNFTIENDNGGRQFFRYGSDANECEPGWNLQAIKTAFVSAGSQLRIEGNNNWRWVFDDTELRNTEVIFDYFGSGNVSSATNSRTIADVQLLANRLKLTRPIPGTAEVDYGSGANCAVFGAHNGATGLSGLATALLPDGDEGRLKVFFSNVIAGGETQVFERRDVSEDAVFVCSDTPTGTYQLDGVVLDGRGGKLPFNLAVEVLEAQTTGGDIEWITDGLVTDPNIEGLVLHLPFDSDGSGSLNGNEVSDLALLSEGARFSSAGAVNGALYGKAAVTTENMPVGFDSDSYSFSFWSRRLSPSPCRGDYLVEYRPVEFLGGPPLIGGGLGLVAGCETDNTTSPYFVWGYNATGYQAFYREQNPDNAWHHYVGIVRSEGVLELYIDGLLVAELSTPKRDLDNSGPLQIGSWYYDCECAFDDFRIYDRAITPDEINALYALFAPSVVDSDGDRDGIPNSTDACLYSPAGAEVDGSGCDVTGLDSDQDGVVDDADICPGTPNGDMANTVGCGFTQRDTDGDGLNDASEIVLGTSADKADTDGDGLTDMEEVSGNTDPLIRDSDGDGWSDGEETDAGTNPLDTSDEPMPEGLNIPLIYQAIQAQRQRQGVP